MESTEPKHLLYDLVLPRAELIGGLATLLGLGLLLGYGRPGQVLTVGLGTLATAFLLRAFQPPAVPPAETTPACVPVTDVAPAPDGLAPVADKLQGIAGAVALVGVLFKLMFWNGAAMLLLVGVATLGPVLLYQAATQRLTWRPALALGLGLIVWLGYAPLTRFAYRDDPALAEKLLYAQAHPRDRAASAEVRQLLWARRHR